MISLRKVEKKDLSDIFNWRNNASVREMMFDSTELNWDGHNLFWERLLADEFILKFMIEKEGISCGVIRLDLNESKTIGEIDIFLNPTFNGQGIGTEAVIALINKLKDTGLSKIIAKVLPENLGSEKMFKKSGFEVAYTQLEFTI